MVPGFLWWDGLGTPDIACEGEGEQAGDEMSGSGLGGCLWAWFFFLVMHKMHIYPHGN